MSSLFSSGILQSFPRRSIAAPAFRTDRQSIDSQGTSWIRSRGMGEAILRRTRAVADDRSTSPFVARLMSSTPPDVEPALLTRGLSKSFRAGLHGGVSTVLALHAVELEVRRGEIVAVIGPHGAGKTTLLLCAAGLLRPDAGSISWFGTLQLPARRTPGVTYVPEYAAYYPFLTVRETLEYTLAIRDIPPTERADAIQAALSAVSLGERADARIATLSRNSHRRVAVAHALLGRPRALLFDETLTGADAATARDLSDVMRRLSTNGVTILLASHDAATASPLADRIVWLAGGQLAALSQVPAAEQAGPYRTLPGRTVPRRVAEPRSRR